MLAAARRSWKRTSLMPPRRAGRKPPTRSGEPWSRQCWRIWSVSSARHPQIRLLGAPRSDGFNDEADGGQHDGDPFAQGQKDQPDDDRAEIVWGAAVLSVPQKPEAMIASNPAMAKAAAVQRKPFIPRPFTNSTVGIGEAGCGPTVVSGYDRGLCPFQLVERTWA